MINTDSLKIIPFTEEHITKKYIAWLNDSSLLRFSEQRHHKHTFESCLQYLSSFSQGKNLFKAIILKETEEHVGNITVYIDKFNRNADIGILIGSGFGGRGYGLEAWNAVMNYLFKEQKIRKVTAGTMSTNLSMLKIFKKSGMTIEGVRKRQFICNGMEVDLVQAAKFYTDS